MKMKMKNYTQAEKEKLVSKVHEFMAEGMTKQQAIKRVGISSASWSRWTQKISNGHTTKPEIHIYKPQQTIDTSYLTQVKVLLDLNKKSIIDSKQTETAIRAL